MKVLIVDNSATAREELKVMLSEVPDFEIISRAKDQLLR
jgi:DNA-binding NarL/FixJ family response regulator